MLPHAFPANVVPAVEAGSTASEELHDFAALVCETESGLLVQCGKFTPGGSPGLTQWHGVPVHKHLADDGSLESIDPCSGPPVVAYINGQGSRLLCCLAVRVLRWSQAHFRALVAQYVPRENLGREMVPMSCTTGVGSVRTSCC